MDTLRGISAESLNEPPEKDKPFYYKNFSEWCSTLDRQSPFIGTPVRLFQREAIPSVKGRMDRGIMNRKKSASVCRLSHFDS